MNCMLSCASFAGRVSLVVLSSTPLPLLPPVPLVIQVKAGGEYAGIQWTRTPIALNVSNGELVDFQQTFVRTVTSTEDWGLYTVRLVDSSNWTLASVDISANPSSLLIYSTPSVQPRTSVYGMLSVCCVCVCVCVCVCCVHVSVSFCHCLK